VKAETVVTQEIPSTSLVRDQQYELADISQLAPHPDNPRRGDVSMLVDSFDENGFYGAVIAQRSSGHVLAGNHRLLAARERGADRLPVIWLDCDDDRARRILLVDNRANDLAGYDQSTLAEILQSLEGTDLGLAGTGYTDADLAALLTEEEPEALTDPDDVPVPPEEPVSKPGDVWVLGPHRVLCDDATDVDAVERLLDGKRAHVMWTDPPYGVEYVGKTKDALRIQNDGAGSLPELLAGAFAVATVALNEGAPFYIAHADTARIVFETAVTEAGWRMRQNLVWVKDTLVMGRSDYHYRHEPILYGFTAGGEGRRGRGGKAWHGNNAQTTVFEVPRPTRSKEHPTMKPVELITAMLANSCPKRGLVFEPFGGSGSTLIAAHHHGAAARVVELDPKYVDVICRRWQEHTGETPVLESTGETHNFTKDGDGNG
jgi:site-specific DNA-methyltransferase (adenine-specific)